MPLIPVIVLILILLLSTLVVCVAWSLTQKKKIKLLPAQKQLGSPTGSFKFMKFEEVKESLGHPELLSRASKSFYEAKVQGVYLVHGTFVGEDPFHIAALLERSFPNLNPHLIESVRKKVKQGHNLMAKDIGNFVNDHVEYFEKHLPCQAYNFSWSSANHHYARLEACLNLVSDIASRYSGTQRILFIGHSHAGQIFAILTQLLFNAQLRQTVSEMFPSSEFEKELALIQNLKFDFVTLGTPARYPWFLSDNMQLLHIINHRGNDLLGGSFKDATTTKKGDYIQQWGIAGSDMKAAEPIVHQYNKRLDAFFGAGYNLEILRDKIQFKNRLHTDGHHLLVDYGDRGKLPNFVKTVFGHGVYTKMKYMPLLLNLIRENFYSQTLTEN